MLKASLAGLSASALLAATFAVGAATPALANTTITTHTNTINDAIQVTCDGPGSTSYTGSGNSVTHLTVNNAGDSWFTTTTEGTVTLQTLWNGASTSWTGHVQEWFGSEDNNKNGVQHATFNFNGTSTSDPSKSLTMHAAFTLTVNANGVVVVSNQTVTCR
jgi:hypothetical protein